MSSLSLWQAWHKTHVLPYSGGYAEQPLAVLAQFGMYDLLFETGSVFRKDANGKSGDISKLTGYQLALVRDLESGDGN